MDFKKTCGLTFVIEFVMSRWILFFLISLFHIDYSCSQNTSGIRHIILLGQSLGAGEEALPVVTDSATGYGNLRFKMGTHTWTRGYFEDKPELRDSQNFTFVPLTAVERGHEGETIANGVCDHLKATSDLKFKNDFQFLFSFSGQGGRLIRELDKRHDDAKDARAGDRRSEGGYYKTAIDDARRAKLTAGAEGKSYSVFAIAWMQGEGNRFGTVNRWDQPIKEKEKFMEIYMNDLIQLKRDLQHDIDSITSKPHPIPFFSYQTGGPNIGTAQLMACDQEKDMYMVGPTYMLPSAHNGRVWETKIHGHGIHLAADGQRLLGEIFGKVMRKVVFENRKWTPLRPARAIALKGNRIRIDFLVPEPPLVLDTVFLPKQEKGFGFEVFRGSTLLKIKRVSVVGAKSIEIVLDEPVLDNGNLSVTYGISNFVSEVTKKVLSVSAKDSIINNIPYSQIEFEGDIQNEFKTVYSEGAFMLRNIFAAQEEKTSVTVYKIFLNKRGNTVLLGERGGPDAVSNVSFKPGQSCWIARSSGYGNLRDSDSEQSIFSFTDKTYGTRFGQKYPLYNWSVAFEDLPVKEENK